MRSHRSARQPRFKCDRLLATPLPKFLVQAAWKRSKQSETTTKRQPCPTRQRISISLYNSFPFLGFDLKAKPARKRGVKLLISSGVVKFHVRFCYLSWENGRNYRPTGNVPRSFHRISASSYDCNAMYPLKRHLDSISRRKGGTSNLRLLIWMYSNQKDLSPLWHGPCQACVLMGLGARSTMKIVPFDLRRFATVAVGATGLSKGSEDPSVARVPSPTNWKTSTFERVEPLMGHPETSNRRRSK